MAGAEVNVRGLRELQRLMALTPKKAQLELKAELRKLAEPVRADAESLAASGIRRIGTKWSKMRVGVTRTLVYVAPRQRGVRTRGSDPRRRPKFADLMLERSFDPALERNKALIESDVEALFDRLGNEWNRI